MAFLFFLLKRIIATIPLLIAITLVAFLLVQAMPGDYASQWKAQTMSMGGVSEEDAEAQAQALRVRLGLDKPLYIQYFNWVKNITLYWDLGESFIQQRSVNEAIGDRVPRTLLLAFICYFNAVTIGILAGVYAATHQYQLGDQLATVFTFLAFSIDSGNELLLLNFSSNEGVYKGRSNCSREITSEVILSFVSKKFFIWLDISRFELRVDDRIRIFFIIN